MKKIPFFDITKTYLDNIFLQKNVNIFTKQLLSGDFILGKNLLNFENSMVDKFKFPNFIGVNNGTDALYLALKVCNFERGSEVITTPMSYLASTSTIVLNGLSPVFADVDESLTIDPISIEKLINNNTKAILSVHLSGNPCNLMLLRKIANKHNLILIEDCAQSLGTKIENNFVGSVGDISCFSFHPLKILGAVGDAGGIVCNNLKYYNSLQMMRNHGHTTRDDVFQFNFNMRLDSLKAGLLDLSLNSLSENMILRQNQVNSYVKYLQHIDQVRNIKYNTDIKNISFNFYMVKVKRREELIEYLNGFGIETKIHYPKLLCDLTPFINKDNDFDLFNIDRSKIYVNEILSLPIGNHMDETSINFVCKKIIDFYKND
jgi:dTDP-4-amino-4,6-dideoxygalactose transaminase